MDLWITLVLGLAYNFVDRQDGQAESSACICSCTLKLFDRTMQDCKKRYWSNLRRI